MNKLSLIKGNQTIEIIIDKYKYLLGNDYSKKYKLIQYFNEHFSNIKPSEYSLNNVGSLEILFNDKIMSLKNCFYFNVSSFFNLSTDLKLSSKSLTAKYLESVYNSSIFYDLINSINILLNSLSDELDTESLIHSEFNALQSKQLLKLVNPQLIVNNESRNEFDLSYEEIIILQLQMIKYILKNNNYSISILLISLPFINYNIKKELDNLEDCIILIDTNKYRDFMNLDELFIMNSSFLDIADEENLYNLINNQENSLYNLTMEEIKMNLNQYLNEMECEHLKSIELLLK